MKFQPMLPDQAKANFSKEFPVKHLGAAEPSRSRSEHAFQTGGVCQCHDTSRQPAVLRLGTRIQRDSQAKRFLPDSADGSLERPCDFRRGRLISRQSLERAHVIFRPCAAFDFSWGHQSSPCYWSRPLPQNNSPDAIFIPQWKTLLNV